MVQLMTTQADWYACHWLLIGNQGWIEGGTEAKAMLTSMTLIV